MYCACYQSRVQNQNGDFITKKLSNDFCDEQLTCAACFVSDISILVLVLAPILFPEGVRWCPSPTNMLPNPTNAHLDHSDLSQTVQPVQLTQNRGKLPE